MCIRDRERYFLVGEREDGFTVFPPCTVLPELRPEDVDEGLLHFACYVAVCYTVYGQSFEALKPFTRTYISYRSIILQLIFISLQWIRNFPIN